MRGASHLLLAIVVARAAPAGGAPLARSRDDLCGACATSGRIANPWVEAHGGEEPGALACSAFFEGDRVARGAAFLPCARCRRPDLKEAAERELAAIVAERDAWLAERRAVDESIGVTLRWVRTEHFLVGFEPERYRTRDKRSLDAHGAAHLYARRLEGMYADLQRLLGYDDSRVRNKLHQVLVFERLKTMIKASELLLKMWSDTSAKLVGDPSILVTWLDRGTLPGDLEMDRHVTHHAAHMLYSVFHLKEWLYSQGFLDEGLAHFFEMRYFGAADNSCNQEEREEDFGAEEWPRDVLTAVRAGRNPSLAELCSKRTDQLQGSDHAFAWSLADYLVSVEPAKLADLMVRLKEKTELREALRSAYGKTFFELENDWKAHVLATYPERLKPARGPAQPLPADELRGHPERAAAEATASRGSGAGRRGRRRRRRG